MLYPTELRAHNMVGVEGFEPPTTWSQTRCATRLRYTPKTGAIDGDRTRDNRNHNPGLYQLSYNRHKEALNSMVGVEGFEPPTTWSQTRCATRLRYTP